MNADVTYDRSEVEWAANAVSLHLLRAGLPADLAQELTVALTLEIAARVQGARVDASAEAWKIVARVEDLHRPRGTTPESCDHCGHRFPCPTAAVLRASAGDA